MAAIILLFAASPRHASQALAFSVGLLRCTVGFPLPSGSLWVEMNSYQHSQGLCFTNVNLKMEELGEKSSLINQILGSFLNQTCLLLGNKLHEQKHATKQCLLLTEATSIKLDDNALAQ
jgi:hypothetical protein